MIEIEIYVPENPAAVHQTVERVCALEGLTLTRKGTLSSYPGCVHWHFKKDRQPGTLELTWWERENRLWFKVAEGRRANWINETVEKLRAQIERALKDSSYLKNGDAHLPTRQV
jgi:hypothetical protein